MPLAKMARQLRQIHEVDLLGDLLAPFIPRGFQVDVEVTNEQGSGPARALTPCYPNVIDRGLIRGWDVAPHDEVPIGPRN